MSLEFKNILILFGVLAELGSAYGGSLLPKAVLHVVGYLNRFLINSYGEQLFHIFLLLRDGGLDYGFEKVFLIPVPSL